MGPSNLPRVDRSAALVAAIALAPLAAVPLPFRLGLWLEGALIVALLAWRLSRRVALVRVALLEVPLPVSAGLLLYAGSAIWGAAVGLTLHNPVPQVVSQCASMLLLPLGFLAFVAAPRLTPAALVGGLGAALGIALVALLMTLVAPSALAPPPGESIRLVFRNDIGFGSLSALVVVLGVAWWRGGGGVRACATLAVAAAILLGSMSRGTWIATLVGVVSVAALTRHPSRLRARPALVAAGATVVAAALLLLLPAQWLGRQVVVVSREPATAIVPDPQMTGGRAVARAPLTVTAAAEGGSLEILNDLPLHAHAIEIGGVVRGSSGSNARLVVKAAGSEGALGQLLVPCDDTGQDTRLRTVRRLPAGTERISISLEASSGTCNIDELTVRALAITPVTWLRALQLRFTSAATVLTSPRRDGTLGYRLREWRAVRTRWADGGLGRLLAGQGLGAVFPFSNSSWDEEGNRIHLPTASYIHNFYVFLGFKLGIAGIVALVGLLLLVSWTARQALAARKSPVGPSTWLPAAATASWAAFLLLSVTSPEILDFRLAPLWGALVAASCTTDRDPPTFS